MSLNIAQLLMKEMVKIILVMKEMVKSNFGLLKIQVKFLIN